MAATAAVAATGLSPLGTWRWRYDLDIYLAAGRAAAHGADPYAVVTDRGLGFTYPPAALTPFVALSTISPAVVHLAWIMATAIVTVVCLMAISAPYMHKATTPNIAMSALLCAVTEPVYDSMHLGQLSPFVGAAAVLGVLGTSLRSSAWLGLAGALKVAPLASSFGLLGRDKPLRRLLVVVASATVVTGVAALLAPALSAQYWLHNIWQTSRVGSLDSASNASLAGAFAHLGVPDRVALPLALVLVAALGLAWLVRVRRAPSAPAHLAIGAGALTVLATPVSWSHHAFVVALTAGLWWLMRRRAAALALALVWTAPVFQWASDIGGLPGTSLQLLRPASLVAIVVVTATVGRRDLTTTDDQGGWSPQGTCVSSTAQ